MPGIDPMPVSPRLRIALLTLITMAIVIAGCVRTEGHREGPSTVSERPTLTELLAQHAQALLALEGVVGVYEGRTENDEPCVKIMVVRLTPELAGRIPDQLGGYPVVVEETGEIRAMPDTTS